ncbi:MAG: class I SAM-dependent methyltransferase [Acidobacteriia bacterium]|nr:class I SAM-dependent methyltransferase [Terriglobia bacterium]
MDESAELLRLPSAPGSLDDLTVAGDVLSVHGWLFQPGCTLTSVEVRLDGRPVGFARPVQRDDVKRAFRRAGSGSPLGFAFTTPLARERPARLDLIGRSAEGPRARLSCVLPSEEESLLPLPPKHLTERATGFHGAAFRMQGLRMFTDLTDQLSRFGVAARGRILDWGCGCGRVARHFATRWPDAELVGCDIDEEAIDWCRRSLRGEFVAIRPAPPTPFEAGSMDVVVACSVLTHLGRADQTLWLAEMRRILAPGGVFIASTHGEYAFQLGRLGSPGNALLSVWRWLAWLATRPTHLSGIDDSSADGRLGHVARRGYYRTTFQSQAYTLHACSPHFEVLDYVERGLNGHQDLIVLRRPR